MKNRTPDRHRLAAIAVAALVLGSAVGLAVADPARALAATPIGGPGTGDRPGYTQLASPLSDRVTALVNVATGDLEVRSTDLTVRGTGLSYSIGRYYNSLATGAGAFGNATSMGNGADVRLATGAGGVVTYTAPSGFAAAYTPNGATAYTSPNTYQAADLTKTSGGWTLVFHGSGEKLTFKSGGQLVTDADRSGDADTYSYNGDGTLHQVLDTLGRVTAFNYTNGVVTSTTDPSGRHTLYSYDSINDLTKVTDPTGAVWQFGYFDGNANLDQIIDPDSNTVTYAYDSSHRVVKATYAAYTNVAATTGYTYNGTSTTVTDPLGHATTYTVDPNAHVTQVVDALGNKRASTYDATGDVTASTDPSAAVRNYTYLSGDRLATAQEPSESNQSGSTPGAMTTLSYGNTAQPYLPSQATGPQGGQTRYGYDTAGNQTTEATYTSAGQPTSTQNTAVKAYQGDPASGSGTTNCGAKPGELCTSTDPRGEVTSYGYDSHGNVSTVTPPAPLGKTSYAYDGLSRVTTVTDGKGVATTLTYDADDRLVGTTTAGAATTYTYDKIGDLTDQKTPAAETTYSYDTRGHVTDADPPGVWGDSYTYDLDGNLTSAGDHGGPAGTTTYGYDAAGEPTTVTDRKGAVTTVAYAMAMPVKTSYPGGVTQTVAYDAAGRPVRTTATSGGTTLIDQTGSYATPGTNADQELLRSLTDNTASTTTAYTYDPTDRLTEAATTGASRSDYRYVLDADGNRTQSATNGTYSAIDTFDAANQLVSRGGAGFGGYDPDGNATSDGTGQAYGYSPTGQTTAITPPGQATLTATYLDTDQTERLTLGPTTSDTSTLGVDDDTTNGQNTYYTRLPTGQLVSERTPGGTYYYLYDLHGDVAALTSSTGTKVDSYTYDPYGNTTSSNSPVANPWRYDAAYQDAATGLYHLGARYYDPKLGRFTQPDPSGLEANTYLFAGSDPVNHEDPNGTSFLGGVEHILVESAEAGGVGAATGGFVGCLVTGPACAAGIAIGTSVGGLLGFAGGLGASLSDTQMRSYN